MEEFFRDRCSEFYESLAFHFKKGSSILKGVDYLMKSGEKALRRYAVEESHQYYREGFELLANKSDKSRQEECLLIDLISQWVLAYEYGGDQRAIHELLEAHQDLAESLGDKTRLGRFYAWLGTILQYRGKPKDAYQYLHRAIKLGEETEDGQIICHACERLIGVCAELGLFEEGITFGERAEGAARLLPLDPYLHSQLPLTTLGYLCWQKGEIKKALECGKDLLEYGDRHSDIRSQVWGWWITGLAYFGGGNLQSAFESFRKALQICQDPFYRDVVRASLGVIYASWGQFQQAEETLQEVVVHCQKLGSDQVAIPTKMYLGAVLIGKGQMARGLAMIEEAQELLLETERKSLYVLSEYILGRVYLEITERAAPMNLSTMVKNIHFLVKNVPFAGKKAEYHLNKAIEVAKEIGSKGFQAQAFLDLGLLHKAKKRMNQARECITTSIELFEQCEAEGFRKQAKEALGSLVVKQ
jgi:tetratricopeptide (TPR) repeat protein